MAAGTTGSRRRALITGITGQDGSYLTELLLERGYRVFGLVRGSRQRASLGASEHLRPHIEIIDGDLLDGEILRVALARSLPDEVYHLGGPSFIPGSWAEPADAFAAIAGSTAVLLSAVRDADPQPRFYLASSGAVFGDAEETPQREDTSPRPTTPYAIAKLAAQQLVGAMREHYGLYACSGITYNHESERRPESFVSRKITRAAAMIKLGLARELVLGDLDAQRDWCFAGDIARAAWLVLQQEQPDDYVLASGTAHTVGELADLAFEIVGLRAADYVRVEPALVRAAERTPSVGDPAKARRVLGWEPAVSFEALVRRMVEADLAELDKAAPARR